MMMAGQPIVWGGKIEHHARPAAPKAAPALPLFEGEGHPSPGAANASRPLDKLGPAQRALPSSPTRGEEKPAATTGSTEEIAALAAEREALIARLEPLGRYTLRRRKLEEQLAEVTTRLLRVELGR